MVRDVDAERVVDGRISEWELGTTPMHCAKLGKLFGRTCEFTRVDIKRDVLEVAGHNRVGTRSAGSHVEQRSVLQIAENWRESPMKLV